MKHLISIITLTALTLTALTSCLGDSNSDATQQYAVLTDSVQYTNPNDTIYDTLVVKALSTLTYSDYTFNKSASVDNSHPAAAVHQCDLLATQEFDKNIKRPLTLSQIQNEIFKSKSDYFTSHGIHSASEIGLSPLIVHQTLWNFSALYKIKSNTFEVIE